MATLVVTEMLRDRYFIASGLRLGVASVSTENSERPLLCFAQTRGTTWESAALAGFNVRVCRISEFYVDSGFFSISSRVPQGQIHCAKPSSKTPSVM
jgi:hypothetical protein